MALGSDPLDRIAELERRVSTLERQTVTRETLDGELRSLEERIGQLRESSEG